MKKSLLLAAFLISVISVTNAQFNPGQKFVSGGLSVNSITTNYSNSSSDKNFNTGINFSAGKFVSSLHSIGLGIFYNYSHLNETNNTSTYKYNANSFGASFFSNYYQTLFKNFYVMLSWNNSASLSLSKDDQNYKGTGFNINTALSPGFVYKLNNRFLLNASLTNLVSLGYSNIDYNNGTIKSTNTFGFSSSLNSGSLSNVNLGFTYLLK